MQTWLLYTIGAFVFWGIWGFLIKLATMQGLDWKGVYVFGGFISMVVITYFIISTGFRFPGTSAGKLIALLAGLLGTTALLFFYAAVITGNLSVIIPLSSLYPAITIILSLILLKEKVSMYNVAGMILALVPIVLLTHQDH